MPRKYIKYDGNSTNPHGFTAANTPSRKLEAKLPSRANISRNYALTTSFKIASNVASSTAPAKVCVVPSEPTMTNAGCTGTSKWRYTSPGSSLIVGKVNSYLSMKP